MDIESFYFGVVSLKVQFLLFNPDLIFGIIVLVLLIIASALVSGSEVAYFSLSTADINSEKHIKGRISQVVYKLSQKPKLLLSTILVANNFINIGVVVLSSYLMLKIVDFSDSPIMGFVVQVILITFILLLFGEIVPKVYATHNHVKFARFMAIPLLLLQRLFSPISYFLVYSTTVIDKRIKKQQDLSIDDLSSALELTEGNLDNEKDMLKGIVEFTNTEVKDVLHPRIDVITVEISMSFRSMLNHIIDSGFSRIPVYHETFDQVKGVLYIKDLLPHIHKTDSFRWQSLIRPAYFVPENKKINDLLIELQEKKIHMAIVVDEYGGTSGIVTLEDIIEEIVGEISDEFDELSPSFTKVKENTFLFDGKISINDFCRAIDYNGNVFNHTHAETLAGFILEYTEEIPDQYKVFKFDVFSMKIESVDHRRIKKIKVTINNIGEK